MPYIQPQKNNYFGFMPVVGAGETIVTNLYLVSATEARDINAGDIVVQTSINTVRAATSAGPLPGFSSSQAFVGVAANTLLAGQGSTDATINSNSSKMLMVYDNLAQKYAVCDTTSGVIGSQVGLYKNYSILTTGCVGSTGAILGGTVNSRSNQALSGVTSTVAGAFHVLQMHPIEQGIYSTVGAATAGSAVNVRKWIGRFVSGVDAVGSTSLMTIANTTS